MSTISYLALDADNDPIFADGTSLTDGAAVKQAVLTRLRLFFGEWWENLTLGLPVFQLMLGQLASQRGLNAMQAAVQQVISGTPYVTSVTSVQVSFNNGQFGFTAVVQTAFGPVSITNLPGASAALGS
jgi:hypothetical protein